MELTDIAMRALKLAPTVTIARIDGALHDILLSRAAIGPALMSFVDKGKSQ